MLTAARACFLLRLSAASVFCFIFHIIFAYQVRRTSHNINSPAFIRCAHSLFTIAVAVTVIPHLAIYTLTTIMADQHAFCHLHSIAHENIYAICQRAIKKPPCCREAPKYRFPTAFYGIPPATAGDQIKLCWDTIVIFNILLGILSLCFFLKYI